MNTRCLNKPLADAELPTSHEIILSQEPRLEIVYDLTEAGSRMLSTPGMKTGEVINLLLVFSE